MNTALRIIYVVGLLPVFMAEAGESLLYKELNLIVGYSEDQGWMGEKNPTLKNSIGFDWLKVFSNDFGDYMTTDLQVRLSYDTSGDFDDDWAIEVHNAWLDYKLGIGKYIRFGHFAPSYGLEYFLDTHSSLFQTLAGRDIGLKKDWGIGYRSGWRSFDYSLAAQLGSGMALDHQDGSYIVSSRIGSPANGNFQYGLSALIGDILHSDRAQTFPKPMIGDKSISKQRVGADVEYLASSFLFLGELSFGQNDNEDVAGALLEINYTIPSLQEVVLKSQVQFWSADLWDSADDYIDFGFGATWRVNKSWTIRSAIFKNGKRPHSDDETQTFVQLYYLGR